MHAAVLNSELGISAPARWAKALLHRRAAAEAGGKQCWRRRDPPHQQFLMHTEVQSNCCSVPCSPTRVRVAAQAAISSSQWGGGGREWDAVIILKDKRKEKLFYKLRLKMQSCPVWRSRDSRHQVCQSMAVQSVSLRLTSACTTPGFSCTHHPPHPATGTTRQGLLVCTELPVLPHHCTHSTRDSVLLAKQNHPPVFSSCLFPGSEVSSTTAPLAAAGQNSSACCSSSAPPSLIQQHQQLLLLMPEVQRSDSLPSCQKGEDPSFPSLLPIFSTHQWESRLEHLQVIISIHLWLEKKEQEVMSETQSR